MNDSQTGCGSKFGPVGGPFQPIQIVPEEVVASSTTMHKPIAYYYCVVTN